MAENKPEIKEGYMPFLEYKVYYRIVGNSKGKKKPLLLLHGGPGATHNTFEIFDKLSILDDRMIITYDQLGCGNSYLEGHKELWNLNTWIEELKAIREYLKLDELHILGHSWGGMLEIAYISDEKPKGIKSAIISSSLSSSKLWAKEQHRRIKYLSKEDQNAIEQAEKTGNYNTLEYIIANRNFLIRHSYYTVNQNSPECLSRKRKFGEEAYNTAWGPNEFNPIGNLKDFDYTQKLKDWKIPALSISGTNDLCSPLIAKTMYDNIPNSRWELFEKSKHCCYIDEHEKYVDLLIEWLNKYD